MGKKVLDLVDRVTYDLPMPAADLLTETPDEYRERLHSLGYSWDDATRAMHDAYYRKNR